MGGDRMKDMKEKIFQKYPSLSHLGTVQKSPKDLNQVFRKYRNEKLLVLMVGVQGSGKTTYVKKHLSKYQPIILDNLLEEFLSQNPNSQMSLEQIDEKVMSFFFAKICEDLENKKVVIVDCNAIDFSFRISLLLTLKEKYTKVVLLVLNPSVKIIEKQIKNQIDKRMRPGLWEDVRREYAFLQHQIREHYIEIGVNDVYML